MSARTVLLVSHSSRPFLDARAHFNAFEQRFSGRDFSDKPPFESFSGLDAAVPFDGRLTIWALDDRSVGTVVPAPQLLGIYAPGYAVNAATFAGEYLVVCGGDRVEVLDSNLNVVSTIRDGWIASCHTVAAEDERYVWLSSAAANAALRVDLFDGCVVERLPLPKSYGEGYALRPGDDLRRHFVPTDWQPTHINAAFPYDGGVLVTLWIQGAVGFFDSDRNYTEITRGYAGCHGGRLLEDGQTVMLSDSAAGIIWWLDAKDGSVRRRIAVDTKWLHDAEPLDGDLVAATLSDKNSIRILNQNTGEACAEIDAAPFGSTTKFITSSRLPDTWRDFADASAAPDSAPGDQVESKERVALPDLSPLDACRLRVAPRAMAFESSTDEETGYLATCGRLVLASGPWRLKARAQMDAGAVSVGVLDVADDHWRAQLHLDCLSIDGDIAFDLDSPRLLEVILCADNHDGPSRVAGMIEDISLIGPGRVDAQFGVPDQSVPGGALKPAWGVFCRSDDAGRLFVRKNVGTVGKMFKKNLGEWSAGSYIVAIDGEAVDGRIEAGVIGADGKWIANTRLGPGAGPAWLTFELPSTETIALVGFAANQTDALAACRVASIRVWRQT